MLQPMARLARTRAPQFVAWRAGARRGRTRSSTTWKTSPTGKISPGFVHIVQLLLMHRGRKEITIITIQ
jgi:hypothetical protein